LSLRQCARLGLVFGFLVSAVSMGASCYRAQIDLTPLADEMAEAGGGAPPSSAGEPSNGGTSEPTGGAPEPGSGGMSAPSDGGAGQPSSGAACDTTPMDPAQHVCQLRHATAAECSEQAQPGWAGCYAGGCKICVEVLVDYPHYFDWHPCCEPNPTCSVHAPIKCNALCPAPTELDKAQPCFAVNL
jgi:hypothetical protein